MARRPGETAMQMAMMPKTLKALRQVSAAHSDAITRDRVMTHGPMMAYVARWFLSLTPESQARVIVDGKRLAETDAPDVDVPPSGSVAIVYSGDLQASGSVDAVSSARGMGEDVLVGHRIAGGPQPKRHDKPAKPKH